MKVLKTPNSWPTDVALALAVLKEKGIMVGDSDGNSDWTKMVTRGEVLSLFERCAKRYIGK